MHQQLDPRHNPLMHMPHIVRYSLDGRLWVDDAAPAP